MSSLHSGRLVIRFVLLVLLFSIVGCGGGPKIPRTVSVSGKIMYKDAPVAEAEVGFVSRLDNKDVLAARGVTDSSGEFTLSTYIDPQHEVSGATPGDFAVTVTKIEKMDQQAMMEQFSKGNPAMVGMFKPLVPAKYGDAKGSPLKATVAAGEKNRFEFKLED